MTARDSRGRRRVLGKFEYDAEPVTDPAHDLKSRNLVVSPHLHDGCQLLENNAAERSMVARRGCLGWARTGKMSGQLAIPVGTIARNYSRALILMLAPRVNSGTAANK